MQTGRSQEQRIRVLVADGTRIHTELLASALRCNPALEVFSHVSDSAGLGREPRVCLAATPLLKLCRNVFEKFMRERCGLIRNRS